MENGMRIIGRVRELDKLKDLYNDGRAELVAIYGRRRVGKTFLINKAFHDRIVFSHAGLSPVEVSETMPETSSRMKAQLDGFLRSLIRAGYKGSEPPESWQSAFYMLEDLLASLDDGSRQVVFLDEIQWLDSPRSGFMTGFEAFWNGWGCNQDNLMVIVCGSSTSWIMDRLINNRGGLYNRVTYQIRLDPFTLHECEEYLGSNGVEMSRYEIAQTYMAFGGIPYYLNYVERGDSFARCVDRTFFAHGAPLRLEFDRLFQSTFTNPDAMRTIIRALGTRRRGLNRREIIDATGIPGGGQLTQFLEALVEGGFVLKYQSFGEKRNELYKLIDPFCLFFLAFVDGNAPLDSGYWLNSSDSPKTNAWRGIAFENICFNHIRQIKSALGIGGVTTRESLWAKKGDRDSDGTQIDLIIERKDNVVDLCEAKFLSGKFSVDKDYHMALERRKNTVRELVPKKATVLNVLICTEGIENGAYRWDFPDVVTLDELFAP